MTDLAEYFRLEARELIDELAKALSELGRGTPASSPAGIALRHAHTLKGAARVVGRTGMADRVHELEEMLGPYRNSTDPVPADQIGAMQSLVDALSDDLGSGDDGSGPVSEPGGSGSVESPVPSDSLRTSDRSPSGVPPTSRIPRPRTGTVPALVPVQPATAAVTVTRTEEVTNTAQTARASLIEIDSLIDGVSQTRTQLSSVREGARRVRRLRANAASGRLSEEQIDELSSLARSLEGSADRIERELREVFTTAERLRLIPVETIVPDLERGVRDVTSAQGKRARLEVSGTDIALDATVLAGAQTALRQIVRNAVAHGVEVPADREAAGKDGTGLVRVEISHGAAGVRFRCTDDGCGIDLAAVRRKLLQTGLIDDESVSDAETLKLLMGSGISTAATVSEISGHGIGLDVVQDVVRRIGGRIDIRTAPGEGTTIDLTAPASMTAQEVVLVRLRATVTDDSGELAALPLRAVRQARRITPQDFSGELAIRHGGRRVPYAPLLDVLGLTGADGPAEKASTVLILDGANGPVAVGVGRLVGTAEIAVRALPPLAPVPPLVSGIWIDMDGRPRPVIDPAHLVTAATARRIPRTAAVPGPAPVPQRATILIVDDSLTTRMLERSILESAGYLVEQAGSAEEGLAMAARKQYAAAVVDVEMPGMDGFGFIEQTRAREELRNLPCILMTTKASASDRERGRRAGARGHIDKGDFHQNTLLDLVAQLVAPEERP